MALKVLKALQVQPQALQELLVFRVLLALSEHRDPKGFRVRKV